jgi:O-antigen/teichoic acid export membrane protein
MAAGSSGRKVRRAQRPNFDLGVAGIVSGGRRAVLTLFDQGLASLSNFSVGVVVARVAGASGLGGFASAYAGWQVLAAMHRALIIDPMAIEGDVRRLHVKEGIRKGLAADILLAATGAVVLAALGMILVVTGQHAFGMAVLAIAPWMPVLTIQDYWRWMGFLSARPSRALANDVVFNCAQAAAIALVFATHVHLVAAVIASWGIGGVAGTLFGLFQYRMLPSLAGGLSLLRSRWSFSKWIAANQLVGTGQSQISVVIAGAILGPVALGGFKAAQALVIGPAGVLIQAGGSIGLPEASKAYGERQWPGLLGVTRWVTFSGVSGISITVAVIAIWGRRLLSLLYGAGFAQFHVTAVLVGVALVVAGFGLAPGLVLKATRSTRWLFRTQVVTMVVSLSSVALLSLLYGDNGTAISMIISTGVTVVCLRLFQRRVRCSLHTDATVATHAASARVTASPPDMPSPDVAKPTA